MLAIFRKYQRFLYIIITFVIVISFSFFGTYSGLQNAGAVDKTVFQAVDGSDVSRSELEAMAMFIGTDNEDKMLLGGRWGPNFLNDGVIKKDFLETGLAPILAKSFLEDMRTELQTRQQREKHYQPYRHPQAQFISAENAWNIVAPIINQRLSEMRRVKDPASEEGFDARVNLYLAERRFPHPALRMVLGHQQKQYQWVNADPNLNYIDLSLYGYHTVDDWFGSRFVRLVSEFIINSAIIAQEKGYSVSQKEALADLYRNAEMSYQQNAANPNLGVANANQYFEEQLRRMGLDANRAAAIWQKVMLFRRLFHDLGNSVFVDPYTFESFQNYAKETVEGSLYQLPEQMRLSDFRDLQRFEVYLSAISKRPASGLDMLELPEEIKPVNTIAKDTPELVQRRYEMEIAQVNKRNLQAKVGIKETWDWQMQDDSWKKLTQKFPELGVKNAKTENERYAALEGLDQKTRHRVDAYSREQIVDEHPEWLEQALVEAQPRNEIISIRKKGGSSKIAGLNDAEALIGLLDRYPESSEELMMFTADNQTYYRITVKEKTPGFEVLTFDEARQDGTLDKLVDAKLEAVYPDVRGKDAKKFRKDDGSWKPFEQVKNQVAEAYFAEVLKAINEYYTAVKTPEQKPKEMLPDYAASIRLYPHMRGLREIFKADPSSIQDYVKHDQGRTSDLQDVLPLENQWKVHQSAYTGDRSVVDLPMDEEEAFSLKVGEWTSVKKRANGNLSFFRVEEHRQGEDRAGTMEKVMRAQRDLSNEAQVVYMQKLVGQMRDKGALSLQYLTPAQEPEG